MKKISIFLIIAILFTLQLKSQTVDSIKVEQAADLIKLHYKILNSTPYQIFKVTIFCSINGGLKSELASISGDCGGNVPGGKSEYLVLWDVLKDVDEVNSVDFSIRAELLKDTNPKNENKWESKKIYILPSTGWGDDFTYGIRLAYIGNWGISGKYLFGTRKDPLYGDIPLLHTGIDLTKRIIKKGGFELHLMAGFEYGKWQRNLSANKYTTYEAGTLLVIRSFVISFGFSQFKNNDSQWHFFNLGIGLRF